MSKKATEWNEFQSVWQKKSKKCIMFRTNSEQ